MAIPEAPTLRPTWAEFEDFSSYVSALAEEYAGFGIVKVVPPAEWRGPRGRFPSSGATVFSPIAQHISGGSGRFRVTNEERSRLSFARFARQARARAMREVGGAPLATQGGALEMAARQFWERAEPTGAPEQAWPPLYGADQDGTLFPPPEELCTWNLRALPDLLRQGNAAAGLPRMAGINTPMLYFGAWRTLFALHVEALSSHPTVAQPAYTTSPKFPILSPSGLDCAERLRTRTCSRSTTCTAAPPSSGLVCRPPPTPSSNFSPRGCFRMTRQSAATSCGTSVDCAQLLASSRLLAHLDLHRPPAFPAHCSPLQVPPHLARVAHPQQGSSLLARAAARRVRHHLPARVSPRSARARSRASTRWRADRPLCDCLSCRLV